MAKTMAEAHVLWQDGKYQQSVEVMQSLGDSDLPPQAQHNKLMAKFIAEDHQDPKGLLTALQALDKPLFIYVKAVRQMGAMQVAKTQKSSLDTDADHYESSALRLNMAILLVQQNKTTAALEVLELLFDHIEPMQENVAIRVCLLLMELYLTSSSYAQAAKVLHYLETAYGVMSDSPEDKESLAGQNSDLDIGGDPAQASDPSDPPRPPSRGSSEPPRPPSRGPDPSRITDNPPPGFGGQADPFTSPPKSDSIGSGVTDEGEIAAVLGRMLDHAGRMDVQAAGQGNRFMEVGGVSVVQLVRILRARLNLALNQLRPARWDIKSILAADPNSPQGISLKAQLELQRQVYRKSAKILMLNSSSDSGDVPSLEQPSSYAPDQRARGVAMLSNMGCVQHAQHKHSTAALCFSQALRKCAQLPSQSPAGSKLALGHDAHLHIAYSAGMQALQLGKLSTALRCFQVAAAAMANKPLLWLRMADCCMGVLQPQTQPADLHPELSGVATHIGSQSWQEVACQHTRSDEGSAAQPPSCQQSIASAQLASQAQNQAEHDHNTSAESPLAGVPPHQCISNFATQCLHNAIFLADQAAARCSSSQHQPQPPSDTPAGSNSLHNALSNPNGLPYPSNGHRGAIGATRGNVEEGSAAEAAEQLAMLSLDRSRATSGAMDAAVASAEERHRRELNTIKASAWASLAYLRLQQQQWQQAVADSEQLLKVPGLSSEHQLLAHCYAAEALCNLQSPQQAAQQLHTAVTLQSFSDRRQAELPVAEAEADADAAPQPRYGQTPPQMAAYPWYNARLADLQSQLRRAKRQNPRSPEVRKLQRQYQTQLRHARTRHSQQEIQQEDLGQVEAASHALQVAVLVNAASMQANQGQLQQAHDYASRAIRLQPDSQQALLALIYVELCKGNCSQALYMLKQQHLPVH
ncbi:MAG: hypothetical protein FRX49_07375 [Trebouxia sp. A1-2]|nr:MAG: hypothetical protein FRX49_07375 [Trebouxia sp. A1-2]